MRETGRPRPGFLSKFSRITSPGELMELVFTGIRAVLSIDDITGWALPFWVTTNIAGSERKAN